MEQEKTNEKVRGPIVEQFTIKYEIMKDPLQRQSRSNYGPEGQTQKTSEFINGSKIYPIDSYKE